MTDAVGARLGHDARNGLVPALAATVVGWRGGRVRVIVADSVALDSGRGGSPCPPLTGLGPVRVGLRAGQAHGGVGAGRQRRGGCGHLGSESNGHQGHRLGNLLVGTYLVVPSRDSDINIFFASC